MAKPRKILQKILSGSKNIRFEEFLSLLVAFGFTLERISGSHHIFSHPQIGRPFPVQPRKGKAKNYQIKQLLQLIEQFELELEQESDNQEGDDE